MMSGGAEVEPNSGVAAAIEGAAKASATSTANTPILTDMRQIYTNSGVALTFARGGGTPESRDPVLARPCCDRGRRDVMGFGAAVEAGSDHRDLHFVLHCLVQHGAEDDVRLAISSIMDNAGCFADFVQEQIVPARDIDQHAARSLNGAVL